MRGKEFDRAVRAYGDSVYRVALHALKNQADAEDVMQTVLLKLFEEKKPFESEAHLKNWLLRVAVNESRKVLRTPWRRSSVPLEEWDGPILEDPEKAELLRAVMSLKETYRVAVYLYYYEGLSIAETAVVLHTKQTTVQSWLFRARAQLRQELLEKSKREECNGYACPKIS